MDKDKALKLIRKAASEGRVEFADSQYADELDSVIMPFLDRIFGIKRAFVSDETSIGDFIHGNRDWNHVKNKINEIYGIEVEPDTLVITVAERIKHLDKPV